MKYTLSVQENILEESAVDWELAIQYLSVIWSLKTMKKKSNMNWKLEGTLMASANYFRAAFRGRK